MLRPSARFDSVAMFSVWKICGVPVHSRTPEKLFASAAKPCPRNVEKDAVELTVTSLPIASICSEPSTVRVQYHDPSPTSQFRDLRMPVPLPHSYGQRDIAETATHTRLQQNLPLNESYYRETRRTAPPVSRRAHLWFSCASVVLVHRVNKRECIVIPHTPGVAYPLVPTNRTANPNHIQPSPRELFEPAPSSPSHPSPHTRALPTTPRYLSRLPRAFPPFRFFPAHGAPPAPRGPASFPATCIFTSLLHPCSRQSDM